MLIDYLFENVNEDSDWCGEQFFIECKENEDPWIIVKMNFCTTEDFELIGEYTPEEAEILGYDTY